jgi:SAM-dependent methyltransferase
VYRSDGYFDERVAATFDADYAYQNDPAVVEPIVEVLAELAGSGRALELGVGTGRIALPLAARSVAVHGIDLSRAMVARLRAKPGGHGIVITIGDFASATADGTYRVAYLVANTIMNLTTQTSQVACFQNVADHLEPGGCFVIEVVVPGLQRLPPGDTYQVFAASDGHWGIDEYDVATQGLISHHFRPVGGRLERRSIPFRYVWPAELDLMAQLAGMELRSRWADWKREPFTSDSRQHVSVWEKASALAVGPSADYEMSDMSRPTLEAHMRPRTNHASCPGPNPELRPASSRRVLRLET